MSNTFRWNYAGGREMLNAPWMVAEMHARAERVKEAAIGIAAEHVSTDDTYGHYIDDFEVESGTEGGIHHDRAWARVTNDNRVAVWVEFGTSEMAEQAVLRRALDAAG
jgi:hypothetical protein